jgi:hypothetical protein
LIVEIADGQIRTGEKTIASAEHPNLAAIDGLVAADRTVSAGDVALLWCTSSRLDESLEYYANLLTFNQTRDGAKVVSSLVRSIPRSFADMTPSIDAGGPSFSPEFLIKAAAVMGYDSATARFDLEVKSSGGSSESKLTNLRFLFKVGKDQLTNGSLSYGEKRLVAFFAMSEASPEILIADELVNGLHHEWIRACLTEIGERQAILTSQNPLLLDDVEFADAADVRRGVVLCEKVKAEDGLTELVWRNPTGDEAGEFFAAYETGLKSVSEVLISKGFW